MFQHEFAIEILKGLKEKNITTTIETASHIPMPIYKEAMKYIDYVYACLLYTSGLIVAPVIQGESFMSGWPLYVICILVGVAIYVGLCALLKKDYVAPEPEDLGDVDISFE